MNTKCAPPIALATLVFMAQGCAAHIPASTVTSVQDGDRCSVTSTYLSKTEGMRTGTRLGGTIVRVNEYHDLSGVPMARLYLAHSNPTDGDPPVLTSTDHMGKFELVVPLWYSDTMWCRNGVAVTERYVGTVDIVVKARHCQDLELALGPENSGQAWAMKCEQRPFD